MLAIIFTILAKLSLLIFKSPPMEMSEIEIAKLLFNIPPVAFRALGLAVSIFSSYLFALITVRILKSKRKFIFIASFLLCFISPWQNLIFTFLPIQNLLLLLLLLVIYLKPKWTVIALSSVTAISILFFISTEKDYIFISSLKPSKLGFEINERQKIDFLAVNKKYVLPSIFRKITYNKPVLAFNKIVGHFVSFFDFDYWASPVDSYAIIKLSGYSPKGNTPLLYFWEIPLIFLGLILFKNKKKIFILSLLTLIPFMIFETKLFSKTAYMISPIFLFLEVFALSKIDFSKSFIKVAAAIVILPSLFSYYRLFFITPEVYQTPQGYYLKKVSLWINKNRDNYQHFIVSPTFGPIPKALPYYLGKNNNLNISFQNFDLKNNRPEPNTIYIGLPGEFVGRGKDLENKEPLGGIKLLDKIRANEEIVFEYGKEIWIGK